MSRVESPFHAIAAEALDDDIPDPDVEVEVEVKVNGSAAAAADVVAITSSDAKGQEGDVVKPALESNTENWDNAADAAAGKNGGGPEQEAEQTPEQTPVHQEQKVSSEGGGAEVSEAVTKKSKKRTNVWTKTTSRKSTKKVKNNGVRQSDAKDDNVLLKPFHQEDDPSYPILLSKIYKAEKIELSTDRLTASGSKGYRMVRATRGVVEGAWYFEIYVDRLGATGHTRMGWSTRRGDIQAPVGYDAHSYSYRDLDGSKVHAALREDYGEAYHEKDVLGFYINLPREAGFTPKPEEEVVGYKGQPYIIVADEPLKPLPGSEILFFKNGVCQGLAFKDLNDGTYFPAASMYTLPSQDCCRVVFNFGPDFKYPVTDLGDRPLPSPMCQASGPGEARAETVSAIQADEVIESMDNGGGKRMAPEVGDAMEVEEATTATKEENTPKEVEKVPLVAKKKVKKPKIPVGNNVPPFLSKKLKVGGFLLHPESKKDAHLKSLKSDAARLGVVSTVLPSQKGSKKDPSGTGLPNPKGFQKVKGLLVQKGIQKDKGSSNLKIQKVKGLSNLKGLQKDNGLPSVKGSKKPLSGTGTPSAKNVKQDVSVPVTSVKGTGLPGSKGVKKVGTGLPNFKESKKDVPVMGSQTFHGSKKDSTVGGLQNGKGTKRDTSGLGLPKPKKMKKDLTGIGLALITSKGFTGTGSALKASKKDLPGTGSVLKASKKDSLGTGSALKTSKKDLPGTGFIHKPSKKDFAGSGHLPKGLGPTAFSGGRSWADGISGQAIDVVVVESSTPTQGAGSFR